MQNEVVNYAVNQLVVLLVVIFFGGVTIGAAVSYRVTKHICDNSNRALVDQIITTELLNVMKE